MTQNLSPAAAREIWAVLAREANGTFTDLHEPLLHLLNELQRRVDEDPEEKPLGWWLDRDVEFNKQMAKAMDRVVGLTAGSTGSAGSTSSKEEFLEKGACAAIRFILAKGATLRVPIEMLEDGFNQQTIKAILGKVFPGVVDMTLPTGDDFPKGSELIIGADSDGVSVGVAVPKGSLHEVKAEKETIN